MQLFLFCIMLIIACEAFFKEFHGGQTSSSNNTKLFRFSPKVKRTKVYENQNIPVNDMKSKNNFPISESPTLNDLMPSKRNNKKFLRNFNKCPKKRTLFRRKFNEINKSLIKRNKFSPPPKLRKLKTNQCFKDNRLRNQIFRSVFFHSNQSCFKNGKFFKGLLDPKLNVKIILKRNHQYFICAHPFNKHMNSQLKEKLLKRSKRWKFKKRKFSDLERQFLKIKSVQLKNKRNAEKTDESASNEKNKSHSSSEKIYDTQAFPTEPYNETFKPNYYGNSDLTENLYDYPRNSYLPEPPLRYPFPYNPYPYLDVNKLPPPIPKINFKYPYEPHFYESPLRSGDIDPNYLKKNERPSLIKGNKAEEGLTESRNIVKLKQMLEEVESALKQENDEKLGMKNFKNKKQENNMTMTVDAIKAKIDNVAIPILSQISEELGENSKTGTDDKTSKSKENLKSNKKNSIGKVRGCSADGTWLSDVVGLEINVTTLPNLMLKVQVTSSKTDGLINKKWVIQGLTLSRFGGPLILAAIHPEKRKMASFIGQCRVCKEEDFIFGSWTITSCAQKYTDLWKSVQTKLDVLKRKKKGKQ